MAEKIPKPTTYMLHQLAPEGKFPQTVATAPHPERKANDRS